MKNDSGVFGEHNISPVTESLSPYLYGLSRVSQELSPEETEDLSTKSDEPGDSGHTENKSSIVIEEGKDIGHPEETPSSNIQQNYNKKRN